MRARGGNSFTTYSSVDFLSSPRFFSSFVNLMDFDGHVLAFHFSSCCPFFFSFLHTRSPFFALSYLVVLSPPLYALALVLVFSFSFLSWSMALQLPSLVLLPRIYSKTHSKEKTRCSIPLRHLLYFDPTFLGLFSYQFSFGRLSLYSLCAVFCVVTVTIHDPLPISSLLLGLPLCRNSL